MQIRIESDTQSIVFRLNNSPAAQSLYDQLPLTVEVEDYAGSEKIFYPREKLDVSDTPMAEGPAGTLAYYEPWGDVAIFYRECGGASGLYELGEAVSGAAQIESLTGEIRIEKEEGDATEENKSAGGSSAQSPQQSAENTRPQSDGATSGQTVQQASEPAPSKEPEDEDRSSAPGTYRPSQTNPPITGSISNQTSNQTSSEQNSENTPGEEESTTMKMHVQVGNRTFTATLENNVAVDAFVEMMENKPVTIQMHDYAGFEKVGPLGTNLPTSNVQTTTHAGDIVLYQGNQIVIFYGSNSWSYTRLGKIDDLSGWEDALGSENVIVTFSLGA